MNRQLLWTWHGHFFGYRESDQLWTHTGKHVGRFYGDEVYDENGKYLGEIKGDERLITAINKKTRIKSGFTTYVRHTAIAKYADYAANAMLAGYENFPTVEENTSWV